MKTFLFFTRLALYVLLITVPYLPGEAVPVPYDWIGLYTWFFLVPGMMFAAFFLRPPRMPWWSGPATAASLLLLSILWVSEFRWYAVVLIFGAGLLSFVWTRMIFGSGRGLGLAALEMFFFGLVYFKMLSFTRSSEDVARATLPVAKALLILAVISFLVHGLVLYLAAFPDRSRQRRRRELLMFSGITLPIVLVVALFVPMTYVQNDIPFNEFNEPPPPTPDFSGDGDGQTGEDGQLADAQGSQGNESGNGLPLGEGDEPYPSERQGGGRELDDPGERETRPDENRGGGGQGGSESELPRGGNGGGGSGQPQQGEGGGEGQQQEGQGGGQGQSGQRLGSVPSDQWQNFLENSSGEGGSQAALMVIASPVDPVYAAYEYHGDFDKTEGFQLTPDDQEPLNELARLHLAETWQDQITSRDDKRKPHEVFYLSSLKQRAVAYRPFRIQPTVEDRTYHPFDLSYHAVSRFSMSTPEDWFLVRDLSALEQERYAEYLDVELDAKTRQDFERHLKKSYSLFKKDMVELEQKERAGSSGADEEVSVPNWRGDPQQDGLRYFARIEALLRGFREHQYEVGFDEDTSVGKLHKFLGETKSGDCTEFAHTAAILGRMAGVPSRVVVGFLASRDLQTPAHQAGVRKLQKKIKPLQRYRAQELYLVTTSHHHAWVQFWMPGFGWIDYESTAFAIPPKPQFNPNNQDVIIPEIEEEKNVLPQRAFEFPWYFALRVAAGALVLIIAVLYGFRFLREWYFYFASRGKSRKALRALFQYLLMRLAREGYDVKRPYETSLEYAERHVGLRAFAQTYTELLFREKYGPGEYEAVRERLMRQYRTAVVEMRKPGLWSLLRRGFSLRSLYY